MEVAPSLWTTVSGWLTPSVLFVVVNVVIGTIAVTSKSLRAGFEAQPSPSFLEKLRPFRGLDSETLDREVEGGSATKRIAARLVRSVSAMSPIRVAERAEEPPRPQSARPRAPPDDEEVDAKADDFINKFRQQLKLQRLDSIVKYRDMLTRAK
ncbi:uncharacterized protein LOC144703690 [Wolffia australiana]